MATILMTFLRINLSNVVQIKQYQGTRWGTIQTENRRQGNAVPPRSPYFDPWSWSPGQSTSG